MTHLRRIAGRTPASSLLAGYHTTLHPLRRKIRTALPLFSGPPGSAAHSGVPGPTLHGAEAVARYRDQPSVRPAVFLHPDTEEAVEHCRHSLSQETPPPAQHSQSGRGRATHRRRSDRLLSHRAHDSLRDWRSQRGVDSPEDQRRESRVYFYEGQGAGPFVIGLVQPIESLIFVPCPRVNQGKRKGRYISFSGEFAELLQ